MIVQTMVQICAKFLVSRLKTGGVVGISFVPMATATIFLFIDVAFEGIVQRIWFIYTFWFFSRQFLFTISVLGWITNFNIVSQRNKRKAKIKTMTSLC